MDKHDTLLLAGGNKENRAALRAILSEGFNLLEAASAGQALRLLEQNISCIAAVLLDITEPETVDISGESGRNFANAMQTVPLIIISPDDSHETLASAFDFGASDVIPIHYDGEAMLNRIENIVELSIHKRHLEALVEEQAAILRHSNDTMVDALSSIIEYRSVESGQHILRIRRFTKILLEQVAKSCPEYALDERIIGIISSASALHDVGKIAIPDAILTKPGPLTEEEREVMKTHAATGCEILSSLGDMGDQEYLRYAHNICHYHHERWDGGGYPEGLKGDDIPICAQVVGLADVYDALTSKRVYKDAFAFDTAANMILNGECGAFSPKLLECFKRVVGQYEELATSYADGLSPKTEKFDTTLPAPAQNRESESLERTRAKYFALVHYIGAFLMELDLDRGLYHIIYNPYPELIQLGNISNLGELRQLILEKIVMPEDRNKMEELILHGIDSFLDDGLRRSTSHFHFNSRQNAMGDRFEVTLLRINPMDTSRRTLAVLCRKVDEKSSDFAGETALPFLADSTFVCCNDENFTLVRLNEETKLLAGYTPEELQETFHGHLMEMILPEDREAVRKTFREQLKQGTSVETEFRVRRKDGKVLWVLDRCRMRIGPDGREYLHSFLTDITATMRTMDELQKKLTRYEIILAQTENILFEWDMQTDAVTFSDTWEKIFGFQPLSQSVRDALRGGSYFHPDDLPLLLDRVASMQGGSNYEVAEVRMVTAKGRYLWCRFRASAIRDKSGKLIKISGIIINIDVEKQAEQVLQDRAERDPLTKLLNKQTGRKQAEEYFAQFPQGVSCAMLIIDLDNFKEVNDRYGHLFGDAVLTKAAKEIKKLFRSQDIIARIGGDEFMVIMRGISDKNLVETRCTRLLTAFRNTFQNQQYNLPLSCSIGIALAPQHGISYYDLFQHADQALYRAKDQGKSSFVFYNSKDASFRTGQRRTTAIDNRIDSDEQPGLANGGIVQYAFQRLYATDDVDTAINEILGMVGRQMNVSRVYVFENSPDNRFCSNTYEWCNEGITPEIENLKNISYETDIPDYWDNFDENGIFYCPDIHVLPKKTFDIVEPQGIKSMLHCAIRDKGVFRGYIGFDECVTQRWWTREQIDMLTYFSEMLSLFLLKKQEQENANRRAGELASILDNQNAWIYIIDPDSCRLKYLNAKTRELAPEAKEGMFCYEALMGQSKRCEGCPARNIRADKNCSALFHNPVFDLHVFSDATLIQWEGQDSCLLTCREMPKK